jgi:DNA-binding NarL/FixJ family response regulator
VFGSTDKWSDATISVLVCDDAALARRQLTVALESSDHIEVVAEAADGDTALAEAIESTPDVIWMGLRLGGLAGVRLIASIRELVPAARIVVTCGPDEGEDRVKAMKAGALAFVRRDEAPAEAVMITERAAWGFPSLEERDLVALRDAFASYDRQSASVQQQLVPPRLDEASMAVLDALAGGLSVAEAAESQGLSQPGVEGTVANALERLHRHGRTEAMAYAVDEQVFEGG